MYEVRTQIAQEVSILTVCTRCLLFGSLHSICSVISSSLIHYVPHLRYLQTSNNPPSNCSTPTIAISFMVPTTRRMASLGSSIKMVPHCPWAVVGRPGPCAYCVEQYSLYAPGYAWVVEYAPAGATTTVVACGCSHSSQYVDVGCW